MAPGSAGNRPPTAWLLRLVELLEDGEWHPYHVVLDEAAKVVPPGEAYRRCTAKGTRGVWNDERRKTYGARELVRATLANPVLFESKPRRRVAAGQVKLVRMVKVPGSVAWARKEPERRVAVHARRVRDALRSEDEALAYRLLGKLTREEVERVVVEMARRGRAKPGGGT